MGRVTGHGEGGIGRRVLVDVLIVAKVIREKVGRRKGSGSAGSENAGDEGKEKALNEELKAEEHG